MKKGGLNGRVLVTGAAGFIGSSLVHALNQRGVSNILVTDVFGKDEKWKNLSPLQFQDCLSSDQFLKGLERSKDFYGDFDTVFHLGACSSTLELDMGYLLENNTQYTVRLAQWCLSKGIRFVYASSAATYGDGTLGLDDKLEDISLYRPLNAYGYSKQLFDLFAWRQGWLHQIVGIKYFNVFGPNEYHKGEMRSLVYKAYEQAVQTGGIRLFKSYRPEYPDGEQMRDFIYVRDAIDATLFLAETPSINGLYNVGAGVARTWVDVAKAIFSALALPENIQFIEMPQSLRAQYQYYTCADISKLRNAGYVKPMTSLEDAIRETLMGYLQPGVRWGDERKRLQKHSAAALRDRSQPQ